MSQLPKNNIYCKFGKVISANYEIHLMLPIKIFKYASFSILC